MRDWIVNLSATKMPAEVGHERVNPDALYRLCVVMQGVELAAPLRVTEVLPVGGPVASAGEARLFDEGFEQDWPIRITSVPVLCQAPGDQGEDAGGEITAIDPRQDEEARVIDHEVQSAPALLAGPADRHVARFGFPGARAKADGGDDMPRSTDEVAQLRSGQKLVTEIVMAFDVGVPEQRVTFVGEEFDIKSGQIYGWKDRRCMHGPFYIGMRQISDGFDFSRRRQSEQRIGLHFKQSHPTAHVLEAAVGATPMQAFADLQRESIAAERRGYREQLTNEVDLAASKVTSTILHGSTRVHPAKGSFIGAQHFHVLVEALPTEMCIRDRSKRVSASNAKNNFGGLLEDVAALGRVDIVKHGRLVAVVLSPQAFDSSWAVGVAEAQDGKWGDVYKRQPWTITCLPFGNENVKVSFTNPDSLSFAPTSRFLYQATTVSYGS